MPKRQPKTSGALLVRTGISLVVLAAAVWVLAHNWQTVSSSLQIARQASLPWLGLAVVLMVGTFCLMAASIGILALHRLRYAETLVVETATAFVNRLLPSGLGSLGLNGVYLYKRGHSAAEATVVVSINNLLGIAVHLCLLAAVLVFHPDVLRQLLRGHHVPAHWPWLVAAAGAVLLWLLMVPVVRNRITKFGHGLLVSLRKLRTAQVARAAIVALGMTTSFTLILFASAQALGLTLGVLQIFIVFSLGMLASTATPTPGGLVGAEAGLFAGFVAYHVPAATAAAAALLYRLVTYWLPLLPGLLALAIARQRKLV